MRKTNIFIKIFFTATLIYTYLFSFDKIILLLYLFTILFILSLLDRGLEWIISVLTLSSIPGLWFSLTTLLLTILRNSIDLITPLYIFIRTIILSYIFVFSFSIIDPVEIYNLLIKMNLKKQAVAILLFYRLVPYGLINFNESIALSKIKGERLKSRIAPALASIIETTNYVNEYCYYKIHEQPKYELKTIINKFHTIVLIVLSIINIIITTLT